MQVLRPGGPYWPESLDVLRHAPVRQLWALGKPDLLEGSPNRFVSIVGTREASSYGLRVARSFAKAFAEAGAVVVSGMARGIDSAAHEAALDAGGSTIAVLGTGIDVPYPVGNRSLHDRIAAKGLVLSESPPGRQAFKGCFPRRNRIIAALSRATIVVEAGSHSGALNTANVANELGRVVAAVPGCIDSPRAAGSNLLLRDSAIHLCSADDALGLLDLAPSGTRPKPSLGTIEAELWDLLELGDQLPDVLAERAGVSLREIQASIGRLEVRGLVVMRSDGTVSRAELGQPELISR